MDDTLKSRTAAVKRGLQVEEAIVSTVRWARKRFPPEQLLDLAFLRSRIKQHNETLAEVLPKANAFCRDFLKKGPHAIGLSPQQKGQRSIERVREAVRDIAAFEILLEEAEEAHRRKMSAATEASEEGDEVKAIANELPPYERRRLLAMASRLAKQAKERRRGSAEGEGETATVIELEPRP
jgi:hypothetical protein